jgi:hypothetical protein
MLAVPLKEEHIFISDKHKYIEGNSEMINRTILNESNVLLKIVNRFAGLKILFYTLKQRFLL